MLNGKNIKAKHASTSNCSFIIPIEYPCKIDSLNASNEYVIGTKNEKNCIHAGNTATGKTAPPNSELKPPKIKLNGSPCLNNTVPAAENIPKLIKTITDKIKDTSVDNILMFAKLNPKNKLAISINIDSITADEIKL